MRLSLIIAGLLLQTSAYAASPAFSSLSQSDFDNITKEFSSNFSHSTVMGPAALGHLWGFELAVIGGTNPSPNTNTIVQNSTGGSGDLPSLYHGGLAAGLSIPLGITIEFEILPNTSYQGLTAHFQSTALKLTLSDTLLSGLPFNLAIRGFYSTSQFSFYQNVNGINGTITNDNSIFGVQLLASPKLLVFEPYLGVGYLSAKDTLGVTGTGTIFNSSYTNNQSGTSSPNSVQALAGLNIKLLFLSTGVEYARTFDSNRYSVKVGIEF
jgi:hypothetical protein